MTDIEWTPLERLTLIARDVHLYDGGECAAITGPHALRIAEAVAEYLLSDENVEKAARAVEAAWGNPTWDGETLRPIDRTIARAVLSAVLGKEPS